MPVKSKKRSSLFNLLLLVVSILGVWFWTGHPWLTRYNLHLVAFLVAFYSLGHLFAEKKEAHQLIWDALLFTAILLLVLTTTGGLGSPFFFLLYFLLFVVALLFETIFTVALVFSLALFFLRDLNTLHDILQILTLFFLTPLALYFGHQYLKLIQSRKKIRILIKEGKELERTMAEAETDSLLWLSLNLKEGLLKIIHYSSELLGDVGRLGLTQKEKLQSVHQTAKELFSSSEKLMEKIDRETD
jgi:hypothetical protein